MKRKYTKRQKGGMNSSRSSSRPRSRSRPRSHSRARSRSRPRSHSRARSRSRQSPRNPIDQELFQQVDPIAMNVYRNTQAIQKIMKELNYIKRALNIPEPPPEVPDVVPQEVDG